MTISSSFTLTPSPNFHNFFGLGIHRARSGREFFAQTSVNDVGDIWEHHGIRADERFTRIGEMRINQFILFLAEN